MTESAAEPTHLESLQSLRTLRANEWEESMTARTAARLEFEARESKSDEDVASFAAEEEAFRADSAAREQGIKDINEEIRQYEVILEQRKAAAKAQQTVVTIVHEPLTYNEHNGKDVSFFRDMAADQLSDRGVAFSTTTTEAARERIQRHKMELDVELPKRQEERERRARKQIEESETRFNRSIGLSGRGLDSSPFEKRVNPNRTDGQGGYFVPPLWLIDQYIGGLRAGRIAAGLCNNMDLPEGTDSINIPKLSTLTQVGVQGADGGAVTSQDYTDTAVTANVKTLAGQEDVAIQLVEQSPGQIVDKVITEDLMADYNRLVDRQVVYGNGTNSSSLNGGQLLGIYPSSNWSGTNVITATEATPNGTYFPQVTGAMASNIAWNRFDLSNLAFLLHPRRWFWYATTLDSTGRPLVESSSFSPFNPGAINVDMVPAEGLAGKLPFGPSVYIDANVPTTDNGSGALTGSYDVAIGAKWDDCWLFEGEPRFRVLPEILSGTLELRYQTYNYVAFLVRYGQSLAIAEGSYFAAPTGSTVTSITF
jgi:HK97 family phage major capsid protein